jgi:hypothetical protein
MELEYRGEGRRQATYPRALPYRKENGPARTAYSPRIRLGNRGEKTAFHH